MKVFNASFTLHTEESTEVTDITKLVREAIQQYPVAAGIALINTLHTTCALFINEFQSALIDDLKGLVERLVPERSGYRQTGRFAASSGIGRVWIETRGGAPRNVVVRTGLTDGTSTELLGSTLAEGSEVIVGNLERPGGGRPAGSSLPAPRLPF